MKKQHSKQNGNQTLVICLLGAACVVALIVLIAVARTSAQEQTSSAGDSTSSASNLPTVEFTPPPFESAAVFGVPEVDDALGWSEIVGRPGYVAHVCGVLRADADRTVAVWFSSDADNDVWLKVRMISADGVILGETGILKPGEYVEKLQLNEYAVPGKVILHIMGYEPDTYYSAGAINFSTELQIAS